MTTRTTVGNTWRCFLRLRILFAVAGIAESDVVAMLGGDDHSLFFLKEGDVEK
jgi:hypothetical protein